MINVTKAYLPPKEEYHEMIDILWQTHHLTNRGEMVCRLEKAICSELKIPNLLFVSNGTIAIQIALKALRASGEVITTPFSYVATTNCLLWEGMIPVFCDILPETFCIDPDLIEELITEKTTAILATHVYGIPCDVERIEKIAAKHRLKVIYDAAHAFGVEYKGKSIFKYGDASTCSFHATKLFHTIEGGSITAKDPEVFKQAGLFHSFGHIGDEYFTEGINAKNSEFHAAMGLCNLPKLSNLISVRKALTECYDQFLSGNLISRPVIPEDTKFNYSYYPVLFGNEAMMQKARQVLLSSGISTRRYFFPSLNTLPFVPQKRSCLVSEDISKRVLCLPLYFDLEKDKVAQISELVNSIHL